MVRNESLTHRRQRGIDSLEEHHLLHQSRVSPEAWGQQARQVGTRGAGLGGGGGERGVSRRKQLCSQRPDALPTQTHHATRAFVQRRRRGLRLLLLLMLLMKMMMRLRSVGGGGVVEIRELVEKRPRPALTPRRAALSSRRRLGWGRRRRRCRRRRQPAACASPAAAVVTFTPLALLAATGSRFARFLLHRRDQQLTLAPTLAARGDARVRVRCHRRHRRRRR